MPANYAVQQQTVQAQNTYTQMSYNSGFSSYGFGNTNSLFGNQLYGSQLFGSTNANSAQLVQNENNLNTLKHVSLFRLILERNMEPLIHVLLACNLS